MLTSSACAFSPTIVFTTGWDPFQVLINLSTFSEAGHAAIGMGDMLLHAYEPGVVYEPRERWFTKKRQRLIAEYEILPDVADGLAQCFARSGEPYDVRGVLRTAVTLMLQRLGSPLQPAWRANPAAHTCAAFVMLLDPHGERIPEWRALNRAVVTPADLVLMAQGPSFRQVVTEL